MILLLDSKYASLELKAGALTAIIVIGRASTNQIVN